MEWHKIKFEQNDLKNYKSAVDAFEVLFLAHGSPKEAALFSNLELEDDHELYFSPYASEIAEGIISKYSGFPCKKPTQTSLITLCVRDLDFDLL